MAVGTGWSQHLVLGQKGIKKHPACLAHLGYPLRLAEIRYLGAIAMGAIA
jgi:hypothetical protein